MVDEKQVMISVIIPVYNSEKYLHKCIDSVLAQTYENFELLLINDGSKDSSGTICDEYAEKDKRVRVFHQDNAGVSAARNKGLDNARGKWVAFVDSDDWVEDEYFEVLSNAVKSHPNADIHFFGYFKSNDNERVQALCFENKIYDRIKINVLLENTSSHMNLFWFPFTKLFSAEKIKKVRFDENISIGEDTIFALEAIGCSNNIHFINRCLYNYYSNPHSVTNAKYHIGLLQNMQFHYNARKGIYQNKLKINSRNSNIDTSKYYIEHILFWLLSNLNNAPSSVGRLSEMKIIRDSIIYQECFLHYKYNWKHPKRSLIIKLFELKKYKLLFKVLKIDA